MYNVSDILFDPDLSDEIKHAIVDLIQRERITSDVSVLKPTAANNDVDGSQHDGDIDFTYEDASAEDARMGSSLGYYEYFGQYGYSTYTGHYYNGSDSKFAAVVIDPPAYAATIQI